MTRASDRLPRRDVLRALAVGLPAAALLGPAGAVAEVVRPRATPAPDVPSAGKFPHALLERVLEPAVAEDGLVDYAAVEKERESLDAYLAEVARVSPDSHKHLFPSEGHAVAWAINAHNAMALLGVLHLGKPKSLADGRLDGLGFLAGGKETTLRKLTNAIRRKYTDPRILLALVKGRRGGPAISRKAFGIEDLDERLESAARAFLSSERAVSPGPGVHEVRVSSVVLDFRADFESQVPATLSGDARLVAAVNRWRPRNARIVATSVRPLALDERLNDVANR